MKRRDFFICHASGDKALYIRPLSRALEEAGYSTWIDEGEIFAGESIIEKVGNGLQASRYVVPIITTRFLSRNWPSKELEVSLTKEIGVGRDIVIPVYDVPIDDIKDRFPFLGTKLLIAWQVGLRRIVQAIGRKVELDKQVFHAHTNRIESLPVSDKLRIDRIEYGYGSQIVQLQGDSLLKLPKHTRLPPPARGGGSLKRHRVAQLVPARKLRALWKSESVTVPREITVVGRRTNRRNAVAAVSYSDIFYFQDVDYGGEHLGYELECKIGRGGIADLVEPSGELHESHPALKNFPVGSIDALALVEFKEGNPICRTPYIFLMRKGIRYPEDLWQSPLTGRPVVNTRSRNIADARFMFQSRQPNGTSNDIFIADFDGSRMCNVSFKLTTAADDLRDRWGKFVGRWISRNTVEFDSMRGGRHQRVRMKDCYRAK
jgi:hypothetical protein